jgi:hypothetical protein
MNARGTSGTFSPSPLLYYHLSRFLGAEIGVPPAVWRSMDRQMHLAEVARPGVAISGHSHSSDMNRTGWQVLVEADRTPETYSPTDDLFTADRTARLRRHAAQHRQPLQFRGQRHPRLGLGRRAELRFPGDRAVPRPAVGQAAAEAVAEGLAEALKDPQIRRDMGADTDPRQIVVWMTDLANIALWTSS